MKRRTRKKFTVSKIDAIDLTKQQHEYENNGNIMASSAKILNISKNSQFVFNEKHLWKCVLYQGWKD